MNTKISEQRRLKNSKGGAMFLATIICANSLIVLLNELVTRFIGPTSLDTLLSFAVIAVILIKYITTFSDGIMLEDLVIWGIIVLTFCVSMFVHPRTQNYILERLPYIINALVLPYFASRFTDDAELAHKPLKIASVLGIISSVLYMLIAMSSKSFNLEEMSFSYSVVIPVIYILYCWIKEHKLWQMAFFVIGVLTIAFGGARGPIVCIIVFVALYIVTNIKSLTALISAILIAAAGVVLYLSKTLIKILEWCNELLIKNGLELRVIRMFLDGEMANDSNRSKIQAVVIEAIKEHPIFGSGIMGDWVVSEGVFFNERGSYPHNIFLELWCQYGVIIGSMLIALLAVVIFKAFKYAKNNTERSILVILLSVGFTKSLFTSTYLLSTHTFLYIGYAVGIVLRAKYSKIERQDNEKKSD